MPKNPLIGSERQPLPGARSIGKADPTERLEVTLVLRHRQHDALQERIRKMAAGDKSERHLTHEEYDQQFGADPTDLQAVKRFANQRGLAVVEEHLGRRSVVLSGTVAQFNDAFGVDLQQFEHTGGSYHGRTGAIHLPDELRSGHCGARPRQSTPGPPAFSHPPHSRQCAVAWGRGGGRVLHPDPTGCTLRLSRRHRTRRVHRHHRTRRRLSHY